MSGFSIFSFRKLARVSFTSVGNRGLPISLTPAFGPPHPKIATEYVLPPSGTDVVQTVYPGV